MNNTTPFTIKIYNDETYLEIHEWSFVGWLVSKKTHTVSRIGNCSSDNFKCALLTDISYSDESMITISRTTTDQDRITELENNKADKTHTHTMNDITNYKEPMTYDNTEFKELINTKSSLSHTHEIEEVNGLVN